MRALEILRALDIPTAARIDRRIPKALLTQHGASTAGDKRKINEGIELVQWVAALKPRTVGVTEYRDELREYLEIAILSLAVRADAKLDRLVELLHRAVPYPAVVVAVQAEVVHISVVHKRWSLGEAGKTVLDLFVLYQGWLDTLLALHAARYTNSFSIPESSELKAARSDALSECDRLTANIAKLRVAAAKEKQMTKHVEMNLEMKRLEAARAAALARL
jgi:hypothetical protein